MPLLLLIYLIYRNVVRAKLKGQHPFLWAVLTFVSFLGAMTIGAVVVFSYFTKSAMTMEQFSALDFKTRQAVWGQLIDSNPLNTLTIMMFGIGGYLLIRYLLDRKPNKKGPEVHWMDKLGHQEEEK
jgi:heme A synthase